jgi:glutamate carboxypeptidase
MRSRLPHYLDLLRQMVTINSFTRNREGVNRLGQLTAEILAELDFTAEHINSAREGFGRHLVLTRGGRTTSKVGFVSHLDTVFPESEEIENDFRWRDDGARIYGPGTVDIKGGTVLMYMMLDALRAVAPSFYEDMTWVLLLDASEEVDGEDFGELCVERLGGADTLACLVFEGARIDREQANVVVARKGMAVYQVAVEGRGAHAGSAHENGANAIVHLADLVSEIAALTDYTRNLTFNVGTIVGGTVVNRVPHFAEANVEMRAFASDVYDEAYAQMLAFGRNSVTGGVDGDFSYRITVDVTRKTAPWPRNQATDRLYELWSEAGAILGLRVVPEERGGLSDGNYFWDKIPTLDGLGPAGGNAHCSQRSPDGTKDQEFVWRHSFVPKAVLNCVALLLLQQQ